MSFASRLVLVVCMAVAMSVLVALGMWQVQRLHWKEALIASVEARLKRPPATLGEIEAAFAANGDVDYWPVVVSGRFDHAGEVYFFTTSKGDVGWDVLTPLQLPDGRVLIVNRGFVPDALRLPASRAAGQVEGETTVTGLARNPLAAKPNSLIPDNNIGQRAFYWRNIAEMGTAASVDPARLLPFYVDAGESEVPGGWPRGGTTIIRFSNNHLGYAITWFGLAGALFLVGSAFLLRGRK